MSAETQQFPHCGFSKARRRRRQSTGRQEWRNHDVSGEADNDRVFRDDSRAAGKVFHPSFITAGAVPLLFGVNRGQIGLKARLYFGTTAMTELAVEFRQNRRSFILSWQVRHD